MWVIPLAVIEWCLFRCGFTFRSLGSGSGRNLSASLRKARAIYHVGDWVLWIVMLLLFLWLPVASTVAAVGLKARRMARALRAVRGPAYWGWLLVLLLVGLYLPSKLIWWIPTYRI